MIDTSKQLSEFARFWETSSTEAKNPISSYDIQEVMDSFLTYVPLFSLSVVAGLFVMVLVNLSTMRKNMQRQGEEQNGVTR